jgi:hypothetical protein
MRAFRLLVPLLVAAALAESAPAHAKASIVNVRRETAAQALADRIARERRLLDTTHLLWRTGLGQLLATRSARLRVPVEKLEALARRPGDAQITKQDLRDLYRFQIDRHQARHASSISTWTPESDLYWNTAAKLDRALTDAFDNAAVFERAYRLQEDLRMLLYHYQQTGIPVEKAKVHLFGSLGKGRFTRDSDLDIGFEQAPDARHIWPPDGTQISVGRSNRIPWINKVLPGVQYDGVVAKTLRQRLGRLLASDNMAPVGTLVHGARGAKGTRTARIGDPHQVVPVSVIRANDGILASIVERSFAAAGVPRQVLEQARAEGARLARTGNQTSEKWQMIIEGTAQVKAGSQPAMLPRMP